MNNNTEIMLYFSNFYIFEFRSKCVLGQIVDTFFSSFHPVRGNKTTKTREVIECGIIWAEKNIIKGREQ